MGFSRHSPVLEFYKPEKSSTSRFFVRGYFNIIPDFASDVKFFAFLELWHKASWFGGDGL